ncbi:MAG: glycosyltransferase family 39 protein [Planctomycetales bacterium]|nr:glycosyltransferase family 39 protein [Planctomycetales bacterium]MBN8627736.1 glycosyltransferase family 39 protein [Planctomycetota bacterium]
MDALLQLRSLLALAAMIAAAWSVGRPIARRLGLWETDRAAMFVWSAGIGLVVWGLTLAALGAASSLYASFVAALTALAVGAEAVRLLWPRSFGRQAVENNATLAKTLADSDRLPAWCFGLLGCAALTALASLLSALAPPVAGDALCYHLELSKRYLQLHALEHFAYSDNSTYPLLAEMWFAWGLALDGPVAAQLMHWFCGVLTAGAAYVAARTLVGRNGAIAAACIVMLTPGINNQMTAPLNDVALAVFTTLSFAAAYRAVTTNELRAYAATGVFLAGALSVKLTGLIFLASTAFLLGQRWIDRRDSSQNIVRGAATTLFVALLLAGPWYARSYWHRGDPVYPFFSSHEVASPSTSSAAKPSVLPASKAPLGRTPLAWLQAPWQMTMFPDRFGGRGHQLGPLWLMQLPLLGLLSRERQVRLLPAFAVALPYAAACLLLRQNVRFLLPIVPLAAIVVAAVFEEIAGWSWRPRATACAPIIGVVLLLTAIPVVRARQHALVAVGAESREAFLLRSEPTFAAAQWANAHLPIGANILSQEQRAFWFESAMTRDNIFRREHDYHSPGDAQDRGFSQILRGHGFTHLLLAEGPPSRPPAFDATLSAAFEEALRTRPGEVALVAEFHTATTEVGPRRYRIVELR